MRELIDATIRTEVGSETVAAAKAEIDAATARLRSEQLDGPYGIRFTTDGDQIPWGNVVIGVRNPVAPPLVVKQSDGGVFADFHLGAAYEGPPGQNTAESRPWCSTTYWAPRPVALRSKTGSRSSVSRSSPRRSLRSTSGGAMMSASAPERST